MSQCYQCAGEVGADGAAVCGACLRRQLGSAQVRSTAEFRVPDMPIEAGEPSGPSSDPGTAASCTWCGKPAASVRKLLGNGAVSICNECVALCAMVMQSELGDGWRGD
jgi:hypothetical protein